MYQGPHQRVWIILFACLCLLASMLYAYASLSWRSPWAWSCLVTSDFYKALFGCDHLGSISGCWVASYISFPFYSTWCYAYHVCSHHPLAFYASLHACSHVYAWVLLVSVLSLLQHNEVMDIRSEPTFVPHGHHLLFAFLLVCLLACLFSCLFAFVRLHDPLPSYICSSRTPPFACHVYDAYLLNASFICSLHLFLPLLVCWILVFAFACTHMERGCMELRHGRPSASKKGEDESMWI